MGVSDNIRELRKREGLTQTDLARLLGVTKESVCRWEKGHSAIRDRHITRMTELFNVRRDDLLGDGMGLATRASLNRQGLGERRIQPNRIPVFKIGRSVHGTSLQSYMNAEAPADIATRHPKSFFVRMGGQEMSRLYPEGCFLLIDPNTSPWNGCSVAALVDGRNIVIRRYISGNDTAILSSHSFQTASPDLMLNRRRVRILGVVVWYQASHDVMDA